LVVLDIRLHNQQLTSPPITEPHLDKTKMAAATTAGFTAETPPALKVKSNQALMDAVEDIVFGSVNHPSLTPTKPH
jgi:hypothetical protein